MPISLVNPLNESPREAQAPAPRLAALEGKTLALLDISKPGGSVFLDRIEQHFRERYLVGSVIRITKPTFAKPAPPGILESLRRADAVVEGLAD